MLTLRPGQNVSHHIHDIAYISKYISNLAPTILHAHVAFAGGESHVASNFTYIELGCGSGFTLCHLAKAYPEAKFIGIDILSTHILQAKALADQMHLKNLVLYEADFLSLDLSLLPLADYIVCHGILSWVSESVRCAIRQIVDIKLKPAGILYVSYNAYPGAHLFEPIKRIFKQAGLPHQPSLERVHLAKKKIQDLLRCRAELFEKNAQLKSYANFLLAQDERYLAHEFLGENQPFYFQEMQTFWLEANLYYVNCMDSEREIKKRQLSDEQLALMSTHADPSQQIEIIDYLLDVHFRRDIYQKRKGVSRDTSHDVFSKEVTQLKNLGQDTHVFQHTLWFSSMSMGPLVIEESIDVDIRMPHTLRRIAEYFSFESRSFVDVVAYGKSKGISRQETQNQLAILLAMKKIAVTQAPLLAALPDVQLEWGWVSDNADLLQLALDARTSAYLYSSVLGAPYIVDYHSAILMKYLMYERGNVKKVLARAQACREEELMRLAQYDDAQLLRALNHLVERIIPHCQRLGVVH